MRGYVEKTLHTKVESEPVEASELPLYLRGLYWSDGPPSACPSSWPSPARTRR